MERIRTKFIVAVTNRLSAAADTNAKLELIEELSDNLYQRYLDFSAQGMDEETAYQKALDDLGDVDELLAYLASLGPDGEIPPSQSQEQPSRSLGDDFMRGLESFLRETISQAEDAVHQAKGIVKDVNDKIKEKYPNGFKGKVSIHVDGDEVHVNDEAAEKGWTFTAGYNKDRGGFFCGDRQSRRVEGTRFPSEALKAVDVGMVNGDVTIHLDDDPAADVVLETESENLEVRLSDDGEVLTVRQGNTASSSFFFGRGLAAADVELTIPRRAWESIKVESTNGDVEIDRGLAANVLRVKTANGDLSLDGANCGLLHFGSASGDLSCGDFTGDVEAETASGDVELAGSFGKVSASTASGDVRVEGSVREASCASMSGDIELDSSATPEKLSLSSKSGDCQITIPGDVGFTLQYSTVSGELDSRFQLVGPIGSRSGEAIYLDGGGRTFSVSTVSGDITLRQN